MNRDSIDFQDRSVAKAYLIPFRCYGTWLHGDDRGSVDRRFYNRVGPPKITSDPEKVERKAERMKHNVFLLGATERKVVEAAIRDVCRVRAYALFALDVRTNHAHVVARNSAKLERMMDSFKA